MTCTIEFYVLEKEREKTIIKLTDHFLDKNVCIEIEKGLYDFSKQYCSNINSTINIADSVYIDSVRNLLFNLVNNCKTMTKLLKKIETKKFPAYNLAFLSPEELDNDQWKKIIKKKQVTDDIMNNLPTVEWVECEKCGKNEYYFWQLQTRSADEPMTTFYKCKSPCNQVYRVNN